MGLPALFSNLSLIIVIALLVVCVLMFFYFKQKIGELEKASVNQAKVLQAFITHSMQTLRQPQLLSNNDFGTPQMKFEDGNPKDKITVSDNELEEEDDEYSTTSSENDDSSDTEDDVNTDTDESTTSENDVEPFKNRYKIQEITDDLEINDLDKKENVKTVSIHSSNNSLSALEVHSFNSNFLDTHNNKKNDGSCDESSYELSNESDDSLSEFSDDDGNRTNDDNISSHITVVKTDNKEDKQELVPLTLELNSLKEQNKTTDSINSLSSVLSNLSNVEHNSTTLDVSNISIVKKKNTHNGSLKVDTLRQLAVDKSLATLDEAKKLKKKDLLTMFEDKKIPLN